MADLCQVDGVRHRGRGRPPLCKGPTSRSRFKRFAVLGGSSAMPEQARIRLGTSVDLEFRHAEMADAVLGHARPLLAFGAEVTLTSTCNITGIPVGRNFQRSAYVEIGLARTCCAFAGGDSTASNRIVPAHLACLTTELAPNPGLRPWSGLQRPQIFKTLYQIVSQSRDQRSRYKFAFFRNKPDTPVPYTPSAKCRHHDITQGEAS